MLGPLNTLYYSCILVFVCFSNGMNCHECHFQKQVGWGTWLVLFMLFMLLMQWCATCSLEDMTIWILHSIIQRNSDYWKRLCIKTFSSSLVALVSHAELVTIGKSAAQCQSMAKQTITIYSWPTALFSWCAAQCFSEPCFELCTQTSTRFSVMVSSPTLGDIIVVI